MNEPAIKFILRAIATEANMRPDVVYECRGRNGVHDEKMLFCLVCSTFGLSMYELSLFVKCHESALPRILKRAKVRRDNIPEFAARFSRLVESIRPFEGVWPEPDKPTIWNEPKIKTVAQLHPNPRINASLMIAHIFLNSIDERRERAAYHWAKNHERISTQVHFAPNVPPDEWRMP